MPHDFESQHWAENRQSLSATVGRLFSTIAVGLDRLHALTFDAPWKNNRSAHKCADL